MDLQIYGRELLSVENLQWAWEKVRRYYMADSAWKSEIDLAAFEVDLGRQLRNIAAQFSQGVYASGKLRPLGQPKKKRGLPENPIEIRQTFWVPVQDQVAWIALVNVIGPHLDSMMPQWSFGNRLHRAAWVEELSATTRLLRVGPYRRSSPFLYRKFAQSWPLYRRYIYLTLRSMVSERNSRRFFDLEERERELLTLQEKLPDHAKFPYLRADFWKNSKRSVYWAGIDFEKFYPNLRIPLIRKALNVHSPHMQDQKFASIADGLLQFKLDTEGLTDGELEALSLKGQLNLRSRIVDFLPTGLMSAGFLANVAMLPIDLALDSESHERQIAHFRYVDDHVVLGESLDSVLNWIGRYRTLLAEVGGIANINADKIEPEELKPLLISTTPDRPQSREDMTAAAAASRIDLRYPKPFLTKTLSRVSQLASIEFELLDEREQSATLNDLELLLLADIGDSELPEATRLSFAATLISRFVARHEESHEELGLKVRAVSLLRTELMKLKAIPKRNRSPEDQRKLADKHSAHDVLNAEIANEIVSLESLRLARIARAFGLLIKVIHEHPDKIRLWDRALDFCASTGHNGLHLLFEESKTVGSHNKIAQRYLDSYISTGIATRILSRLRTLDMDFVGDTKRKAWYSFLQESNAILNHHPERTALAPLGQRNYTLLAIAIGTASLWECFRTSSDSGDESIDEDRTNTVRSVTEQIVGLIEKSGRSIGAWVWWLDSTMNSRSATSPTTVWQELAKILPIDQEESWAVWELYPRYLPASAIRALLDGSRKISEDKQGWLMDVIQGAKARFGPDQGTDIATGAVSKALHAVNTGLQGFITLADWGQWVQGQQFVDVWDPRIGEWTSLEIIRQALYRVLSTSTILDGEWGALHPLNILIPTTWADIGIRDRSGGAGALSWEKWREICQNEDGERGSTGITLREKQIRIRDVRYFPNDDRSLYPDTGPMKVRAAGLLLLGLLLRSFDLPVHLNRGIDPTIWDPAIRTMVGKAACSSWTTAILEGALLSRARESFLLEAFREDYAWDSDTTNDPPTITSLDQMLSAIEYAQSVLVRYQITVQNNQPRQLVPILIEQVPRFHEGEGPIGE